jgi:hypothetical protein
MKRATYLIASLLVLGVALFASRTWGTLLTEGKLVLVPVLALPALAFLAYRWAFLPSGRKSIETGIHQDALSSLHGRPAAAAGRRLIVLGRCIIYFVLGIVWLYLLVFIIG